MANPINDISSKANGQASDFKTKIQGMEQDMGRMAHKVGENVGEMSADISEKVTDGLRETRHFIRENPTSGVLIAAAAGAVAGSLLTMAMRSRKD